MALPVLSRFVNIRSVTNVDKNVIGILGTMLQCSSLNRRTYTSISPEMDLMNEERNQGKAPKKMSKAMKAYLDQAKAHDAFIKKEIAEYEIGKRHLANMMGEDAETFTQADIDRAIQYLFPSGLFEPQARPMLKHPDEVFPQKKEAEFDETGRPYHSMFYTVKPNYYEQLYNIMDTIHKLNKIEDDNANRGIRAGPRDKIDTIGLSCIQKTKLENMMVESLSDQEYEYFKISLVRLMEHPYSMHAKEFILKFQEEHTQEKQGFNLLPMEYNEEGRPFVTVKNCVRKSCRGEVTVWGNGTGKITINGKDILSFDDVTHREQIIFPLMFAGMDDKVDIEAKVTGGGPTGQSGAVRWGIAWGLRTFVDEKMIDRMRIAGLLTRDFRRRERKKIGQEGARRKYTWKKR